MFTAAQAPSNQDSRTDRVAVVVEDTHKVQK